MWGCLLNSNLKISGSWKASSEGKVIPYRAKANLDAPDRIEVIFPYRYALGIEIEQDFHFFPSLGGELFDGTRENLIYLSENALRKYFAATTNIDFIPRNFTPYG